ncbi:MAG: flagellar basal body rod protein FlgC [Flavobacteriales bacterium]|jgi:flagellar basal-body rod protein FlgC|nr:flagellar basal body rod protein FlgC [Flavobacteriales bacterium]
MSIQEMFRSQYLAGSALKAGRGWMNTIMNNLANSNTVDTGKVGKDGNYVPYKRQVPVFSKVLSEKFRENKVNEDILNGVKVEDIADIPGEVKIWDPSHPAARRAGTKDAGYVYFPKVVVAQEMADMRMASAYYEANLSAYSVSNKMMQGALSLGKS